MGNDGNTVATNETKSPGFFSEDITTRSFVSDMRYSRRNHARVGRRYVCYIWKRSSVSLYDGRHVGINSCRTHAVHLNAVSLVVEVGLEDRREFGGVEFGFTRLERKNSENSSCNCVYFFACVDAYFA